MFFREENPALFDCLVEHIKKFSASRIETAQFGKIRVKDYDFGEGIPDEFLDRISYLHIDKNPNHNVQSLEGIQKLKNLDTLIISTNYEEAFDWSKYGTLVQKREFGEQLTPEYNLNQIEDITPLYECKNLEVLQFYGQRSIKEIDLSNWLNLKILDMYGCFNLRTVKGLQKLKAFDRLWRAKEDEYSFEFFGCNRLEKIEGFLDVAKKCTSLVPKQTALYLPILVYFNMYNKDPQSLIFYSHMYENRENRDFVSWTENVKGISGCLVEYSAKDMVKMHKEMREVLQKVCNDDMTQMEKMYAVYDWITTNVSYDYRGLNFSQGKKRVLGFSEFAKYLLRDDYKKAVEVYNTAKARIKQTKLINNCIIKNTTKRYNNTKEKLKQDAFFARIREVKQDRRLKKAAEIRSSHSALFGRKGVCVGISNLYNTFLVSMGYEAMPCFCRAGHNNGDYWGQFNHQMSQCSIKSSDGKMYTYYFDPTLDLGNRQKRYFCLNKEEIEQDHDLSIECFARENGPSMQVAKQNSKEEMQRGV